MSLRQQPFNPPIGLLSNEEVIWAQKSSWAFSGKKTTAVLLALGGLFFVVGVYSLSGPSLPVCTNRYPQTNCGDPSLLLGIGMVIVLGGLFSLYRTITQRGTRYYLTTFRLVRARGGKIERQIPRALYKGKVLSQFLNIVPFSLSGGVQNYGLRVLDPESGEAVMTLSNVSQESVKLFESMTSVLYCQYCGRKNNPTDAVCNYCGANL